MILFFSILIGYLLGSISPAYFFGWIFKKQDIRTFGTHNAGATNVFKNVGKVPGVITGIYDLGKGLLAVYLAWRLGLHDPYYLLAGLGAFLGHVFPFYLRFRGGQGVAVLMSLFFFIAIKLFLVVPLPWPELTALIFLVLALIYITNKGDVLGVTVIPLFWLVLIKLFILYPGERFHIASILAIFIYIFLINVSILRKEKKVILSEQTRGHMLHWRTILRPLAVLIPVIYFYTSQKVILWILGPIGLALITMDLSRLLSHRFNWFLFNKVAGLLKKREKSSFSSLTYFLTACFLAILLFNFDIAALAITFMVFGDLGAKFFGSQYSRVPLIRDRTLEGLLAYFGFSLFFGTYLGAILGIPFWFVAIGAATAALTDMFSVFGVDDNFTVALFSGGLLESVRFFIK